MNNLTTAVKTMVIAALLLVFTSARATTYYFSSSSGNDNRTSQQAQQAATPWHSLQKLQRIFHTLRPGDSVLFKRGDTFYGSLVITASGNASAWIVLSAYGSGNHPPIFSGLTTVNDWRPIANGIWESPVNTPPDMPRIVLLNGKPETIGRYPNISDANGGYLTVQAALGAATITGTALPANDLSGADVVIRKNHWVLDRNPVISTFGKTINFISESGYWPSNNYGYFIQNHMATLDLVGEWYYNKRTNRLGIFLGGQDPSSTLVEASKEDRLITIRQQGYIIFQDLVFRGANAYAFDMNGVTHIQIKECTMLYTGNTAVHITNSEHIWIEGATIDYTNNIACDISNTPYVTIVYSSIYNTGTVPGSGKGDSGSYEALLLSGDNQRIEGNTILNTGYIPLTFNGNAITIRNNFISRYGFVKDDGGGIYTWNNTRNAPGHWDRTIEGNIVLEGVGASDGTADKKKFMHGIYIDDNADHVTIKNNSIAHCSQYGIYIHNAHDLAIDGNTLFNNETQVAFIHDNVAPLIRIRNVSFTNNINFSKTAEQRVAVFRSIEDDLTDMGTFDYNYYCRPFDEHTPIDASWKSAWSFFDVAGWQQFSKQDAHSKPAPITVPAYQINSLIGTNKYPNGQFNTNINDLYSYAAFNNSSVAWAANSPLSGGALRISFSNVWGQRRNASVIINIGSLKKGQPYLLRYQVAGATNRYVESYLRKSFSPYNDVSERKLSLVTGDQAFVEVLFTPTATESNASIGLDIQEQNTPLYIDNLQLLEANITYTNPDDAFRFIYNKTSALQTIALNGNYMDVSQRMYSNEITLPPFSSAILLKIVQQPVPFTFNGNNAANVKK
jgi:parallel beta-helix repeat protein